MWGVIVGIETGAQDGLHIVQVIGAYWRVVGVLGVLEGSTDIWIYQLIGQLAEVARVSPWVQAWIGYRAIGLHIGDVRLMQAGYRG
jgi:hypothetical protein